MLELAVVNLPEGLTSARGPRHAATASPTPSKPVAPVTTSLATSTSRVNPELALPSLGRKKLKRCIRAACVCCLHAISSATLGLVQRPVRGGKERVAGIGACRVRRDSKGGGHVDLCRSHPYGLRAEQRPQPLGDLSSADQVGLWKEDRHLLATIARAEVDVRPKRAAEEARGVAQDRVTGVVAMLVVHPLEVIEIGEQERNRTLESVALGQQRGQALVEGAAVRESGQRIPTREIVLTGELLRRSQGERGNPRQ